MQLAVVLVLALLIGITLGAVGGGGSILAVPVLVGVAGLTVTEATTASLIVVGTAAAMGLLATLRSATVRIGTGFAFGVAGIGGAALGTHLNKGLDEGVLLLAFAGLMAVVAAKMTHGLLSGPAPNRHRVALNERGALTLPSSQRIPRNTTGAGTSMGHDNRAPGPGAAITPNRGITIVRILLAGTTVGFLTGLFGVGGGFVIVPALMFLLAFDIRSATATSLLVIALNSAVALVMRADLGSVDWSVVAPFTLLAAVGVLLGRGVADRMPPRALSAALTVLIITMAIWTAIQGIGQIA